MVAWPVAAAYIIALTVLAAVLIILGYALAVLPGLPDSFEDSYARALVWFLNVMLRPFDVLPPTEPPTPG